jgi:hypothetical protein
VTALPTGGIHVTLDVCVDPALLGWILGFGPLARAVAPAGLARQVAQQLAEAGAQYMIEP